MADVSAKRRGNRILRIAMVLGIVMLMVAGVEWTLQPRWRTYTFPADPKTGIAVAIDYPDSLEIDNAATISAFAEGMGLQLSPHPPGPLARWWQTYVLRQNPNDTGGIIILVEFGQSYLSVKDIEGIVADMVKRPGSALRVTHTRHALGPAMEAQGRLGNGTVGIGGNNPIMQMHGAAIWPQAMTGGGKACVIMLALAPPPLYGAIGPAVDGMIPRVHLVRKR